MSADAVTAFFEFLGGLFVIGSIFRLLKDKMVRGVHWPQPVYFTAWGFWNLYYYPHLNQWISFWGGAFLVVANAVWLGMFWYYKNKEKSQWPFPVK